MAVRVLVLSFARHLRLLFWCCLLRVVEACGSRAKDFVFIVDSSGPNPEGLAFSAGVDMSCPLGCEYVVFAIARSWHAGDTAVANYLRFLFIWDSQPWFQAGRWCYQ